MAGRGGGGGIRAGSGAANRTACQLSALVRLQHSREGLQRGKQFEVSTNAASFRSRLHGKQIVPAQRLRQAAAKSREGSRGECQRQL